MKLEFSRMKKAAALVCAVGLIGNVFAGDPVEKRMWVKPADSVTHERKSLAAITGICTATNRLCYNDEFKPPVSSDSAGSGTFCGMYRTTGERNETYCQGQPLTRVERIWRSINVPAQRVANGETCGRNGNNTCWVNIPAYSYMGWANDTVSNCPTGYNLKQVMIDNDQSNYGAYVSCVKT